MLEVRDLHSYYGEAHVIHGVSLNVAPDLSHFDGIVPCGITDQGVTSFEDLGLLLTLPEVDSVLRSRFEVIFGPTDLATAAPADQLAK